MRAGRKATQAPQLHGSTPPVRISTAIFIGIVIALCALSWSLGQAAAGMQRLETFKLLNILGLSLDLLGLIVLAEFVVTSERLKNFVVLWIAGAVLWGITVVPIGAWFGALAYSEGPSSAKAANFFINLFGYAVLPLGKH